MRSVQIVIQETARGSEYGDEDLIEAMMREGGGIGGYHSRHGEEQLKARISS